MNFYLITYDIPNDKRRNKIASILQDFGKRVQFSVFEVWLEDAHKRDLIKRLRAILQPSEDSVRIYWLCGMCRQRVETLGQGDKVTPPGVIIL